MKRILHWLPVLLLGALLPVAPSARGGVIFEHTSVYHNIRVVDTSGYRFLSFDGSQESRMSLGSPLVGHFEYTEYFHMPWLWCTNLTDVLMIGLGGGSTQRSFLHYYPGIKLDTVELDPAVVETARRYFLVTNSPRHQIIVSDGRQHIRRAQKQYDAVILDAYRSSRYGSFIPYHMATREFFSLVNDRLTTNGVVAYNIIGSYQGYRSDILGSMYRTMKSIFPQVYAFPARDSANVVLIGTKSPVPLSMKELYPRAVELAASKRVTHPSFRVRVQSCRFDAPPTAAQSPILTDDFAPIDGLLTTPK